jgi:hypothetical protein
MILKDETVGPFWTDWRLRVPSTGYIAPDVQRTTFATVEDRKAFTTLADHSCHVQGGHCPTCGAEITEPFGVSPVMTDAHGFQHVCPA